MAPWRDRAKLLVLLTGAFSLLGILTAPHTIRAAMTDGGWSGSTWCSGALTLVLRPGSVPPARAFWNKSPSGDIPPGPLIERFPLYPGAIPSSVIVPSSLIMGMPPGYRKVARAEFQVPAWYQAVSAWFRKAFAACGLYPEGTLPLQQHGGPAYAGLEFVSRDGLSQLTLVFRPLSDQTTAVLYFARTLDLPPRPAASFLHGPFTRVKVNYQSVGAVAASNYRYRFTITWPATITRLVAAINKPTRIWVPVGAGGTVISVLLVHLSFVRRDGGARTVLVGGRLDQIIVGHTRPLVDLKARVLKLVSRITRRRCPHTGSC